MEYSYNLSGGEAGMFAALAVISTTFLIVVLALIIIAIVGMWKVFEKAGHEGWKSLIPIYNIYMLTVIAGLPGWIFLLLLIPFINMFVVMFIRYKVAKAFGKSDGFGILVALLPFVGYLILGFGKENKYVGPEKPLA